MNECEIDVSIGETLCLGDISVTILGIEDGEIHFRIDSSDEDAHDATIEEARTIIGDMEGAVVKWTLGFHSARTLMPEAGYEVIREHVRAALGRLDDFEPYRMEGPIELEISFKNYMPAEVMAYLPIVDRVDAHTIRFVGQDMTEISKFIEFTTTYAVSITP